MGTNSHSHHRLGHLRITFTEIPQTKSEGNCCRRTTYNIIVNIMKPKILLIEKCHTNRHQWIFRDFSHQFFFFRFDIADSVVLLELHPIELIVVVGICFRHCGFMFQGYEMYVYNQSTDKQFIIIYTSNRDSLKILYLAKSQLFFFSSNAGVFNSIHYRAVKYKYFCRSTKCGPFFLLVGVCVVCSIYTLTKPQINLKML